MTQTSDTDALAPMDLGTFAPYLMNRIMHRYNQNVQTELAPLGLSVPKMRALAALAAKDTLTVNELAVFAIAEQSTMSRTVDQMERDGLIRRDVHPADSRARAVSLTEAGKATYASVWPIMQKAEADLLDDLDPETTRALLTTLNRILRNIRRNDF